MKPHPVNLGNAPVRAPTTILVNWQQPGGGVGSIRVEPGETTCAAVKAAREAGGTGIQIREVDRRTGLTVDRVRVGV